MTDHDLFALNKIGFIPGPEEDEKNFLERVELTKKKFAEGDWIPESHWDWVRTFLEELFDVKPLYICAFYSNKGLTLWQGGASWIEGRSVHSVQLRKGNYLRYGREEIMAHEAIHAVRSGFDEQRFEEFFAYQASERRWRRALGPIIQRPWEVWPFLGFVLLGIFWPTCYLGAAFWVGIGFCRLILGHMKLRRASTALIKLGLDRKRVRAVLFRLTDREIALFGKEDIRKYAAQQKCLRWRVISNYLSEV